MIYPTSLLDNLFEKIKNKQLEGFLPGYGNENAKIMLIGEAPGKTEVMTNIPFSGKSGKILDNYLEGIGLYRKDIYLTSTLRSRPYKIKYCSKGITFPNRKPTSYELITFSPLLDFEIKEVNPKMIITLGDTALKRILNKKYKISSMHGQLLYTRIKKLDSKKQLYTYTRNNYYVFPLFHPASIFYNPKLKNTISNDLNYLNMVLDHLNLR
ncbi:uracil-DNA glycosylase [Enterococcus faecium]|nr:uracil-DNA glycosylase [Enterococcus faecium]MBK5028833.1 uracil-DNA glycosylase [Enterococcus faecium]MBK5039549.1 uracil-DNA glycosylase [Enterococcus faecium]MBK5044503.1 uracil-DNA glycosylase [Enterococcus faecium]MBK5069436.1 uracil-DNA glycosylase [Enterococcus faecium]MBK5132649.1 uracil-DNA glycosylase [Enterococcus faecium]